MKNHLKGDFVLSYINTQNNKVFHFSLCTAWSLEPASRQTNNTKRVHFFFFDIATEEDLWRFKIFFYILVDYLVKIHLVSTMAASATYTIFYNSVLLVYVQFFTWLHDTCTCTPLHKTHKMQNTQQLIYSPQYWQWKDWCRWENCEHTWQEWGGLHFCWCSLQWH